MTGLGDVVDSVKISRRMMDLRSLHIAAQKYASIEGDIFMQRDLERCFAHLQQVLQK